MAIYAIIQRAFITIGVFVYPIRVNTRAARVRPLLIGLSPGCGFADVLQVLTCVRFWLADRWVPVWARTAAWRLIGHLLINDIAHMPPSRG